MSASNQQTLAESGASEIPPMFEKKKLYTMGKSVYENPDKVDDPTAKIIEPISKMTESNKQQKYSNIKVINYLLQGILNDIYNSVDACTTAKQMWERIRRLMHGSEKLNNKDPRGEYLYSVYERLKTLVNNANIKETEFDHLFDTLNQYEPHVIASRAKKAARNHDPLALFPHSNVHSSHSHIQEDAQEDKLTTAMVLLARAITQCYSTPTNNRLRTSSNTRNQAVIQDGRVDIQSKNVDYARNGHYARDCPQPKVCDAKYFREQMLLEMKDEAGGNLNEKENNFMLDNHYGDDSLEELNAAVIIMERIQPEDNNDDVKPKHNAKTISEVNASQIHLKSQMHFESVHEHTNHAKLKIVINTSDDDQIDSGIIFDDPYMDNNSGTYEHDSNSHDQFVALEYLIYIVKKEAENECSLNNELKKQKTLLQKELEICKERVRTLEKQPVKSINYEEEYEELEREIRVDKDKIDNLIKAKDTIQDEFFQLEIETDKIRHETELSKKAFKEREKSYLDELVDLGENLSSHDRIVYKMGQSIQTIHTLGKKPNKVYDPFLKVRLGYQNPERLKKVIKAQPKMYDGEKLQSTELIIDSPNSKETLEDVEKSRLKMKDKMIQLNYEKLNALYETFVPQ
ncbi:hypothetical protein Tco_0736818 [Tanacetum coccineum]